jgi:anthranilate/para-aminobenzoate synthase component II
MAIMRKVRISLNVSVPVFEDVVDLAQVLVEVGLQQRVLCSPGPAPRLELSRHVVQEHTRKLKPVLEVCFRTVVE